MDLLIRLWWVFVAVQAFPGCREQGLSLAVVRVFPIEAASLVAEHRLLGVWAQ